MMDDREWMYMGWSCGGNFTADWVEKTETFLNRAFGVLAANVETHVNIQGRS